MNDDDDAVAGSFLNGSVFLNIHFLLEIDIFCNQSTNSLSLNWTTFKIAKFDIVRVPLNHSGIAQKELVL